MPRSIEGEVDRVSETERVTFKEGSPLGPGALAPERGQIGNRMVVVTIGGF